MHGPALGLAAVVLELPVRGTIAVFSAPVTVIWPGFDKDRVSDHPLALSLDYDLVGGTRL